MQSVEKKLAKPPKRDDLRSDDDDNYSVASSVLSNTDTNAVKGGIDFDNLEAIDFQSNLSNLDQVMTKLYAEARSNRDTMLDQMSKRDYYDDAYKRFEFEFEKSLTSHKKLLELLEREDVKSRLKSFKYSDDGLWAMPVRPPVAPNGRKRLHAGGALSGNIFVINVL